MTQPLRNTTNSVLPDYKAVLWDMDGTLVDSEPLHHNSVRVVGDKISFPVSQDLLDKALGVGHQHCYTIIQEQLNMNVEFPEWLEMVEAAYLNLAAHIVPRHNTVEVVKALYARGIKQAVFSNSTRNLVEANVKGFLRFFDLPDDIFSTVISIDDVKERKPSGEGYIKAAQILGVEPSQCLVVEDSPTGVKAGKAAGCFTIFWPEHDGIVTDVAPDIKVTDLDFLL